MSRGTLGKPLKGLNSISQRGGLLQVDAIDAKSIIIEDIDISEIIGGDFVFDPIDIDSGTVDGVVIGGDVPGPAFFSTIQTGSSGGTGFNVIFYGTTIGQSVYWDANAGSWNISGDLAVTGESDFGNLNISGNTISSSNTDGDIILDPAGSGCVTINSCINQSSILGNVEFEVLNGDFNAIASNDVKLESLDSRIILESHGNTEIETHTGNIELTTEIGHRLCINNISTGVGTITITTKTDHNLTPGESLTISNSNSTPSIDGMHIATSILSNKSFTINATTTGNGTMGTIRLNIDIASISIGLSIVEITSVYDHNLRVGDTVTITNTNSTPTIDGTHIVNSVINATKYTIVATTTGTGSSGNVTKELNSEIIFISPKVSIEGDINLGGGCDNGFDMNIYSKNIKTDGKIIQLGGIDTLTADDNKDRGVSFNWFNGSEAKTGFFGFDDSLECFTFIPDATITDEVVTGTVGCINVGDIKTTGIDVQGGNIINISSLNTSEITGDPDITLTTRDIYLNAEGDVNIPTEVGLTFGDNDNKIEYNLSAGGLCIESDTNIKLTPGISKDVIIPSNNGIILDGNTAGTTTQKIESDGADITVNTGDLNLTATGDINIPSNVGLTFGGDSQKIEYDGSSLTVSVSGDIKLEPITDVKIPCDKGLIFTGDTVDIIHKIESDCTDLTITATKTTGASDINLTAKTNINIPQNVGLTFANDNQNIVSNGTNMTINSSGDIDLLATNNINIPTNVGLTIGDDNTKIENNGTDISIDTNKNIITTATGNISTTSSTGDISLISTTGDIYLTPTDNTNSIIIPQQVDIQLGASTTNITSDTSNNMIVNSGSSVSIVSGDDINLSATNQILVPANVEMEFGGSTEYVSGDGTNMTVSSGNNINLNSTNTIISGNLQVNGTTTTVNSSVLTVDDPIITLGGDTDAIIDDNKDRGIEFRWHNGTSAKKGFFGFDDSNGCFTFIPDATNLSEVISGAAGCMKIADLTTTNIDLSGGNITNSNIINTNELHGEPDLNLSATQDIYLTATQDINIPSDVGLTFGDDSNKIEYTSGISDQLTLTTDGNYRINSSTTYIQADTDITLDASSSVNIPSTTRMEFGGATNYIVGDGTDLCFSSLNDIKFEAANIKLNATNSVDIPTNIPLNLNGSETSYLLGNTGGDVTIVGEKDILLIPGGDEDVRIPTNSGLVFETTGVANKIEYNGVDLCIDSSGDIKLSPAGGDINIGGGSIINGDWQGNTILATYGGTGHGDWTVGSVVFAGTTTALEEDNTKFYWKDSIDRLYIGTNSASDLSGGLTIANSGTLSFRNNFNNDEPGITFQNTNQTYTWNIYRSEGSTDNSNFHIAGGINESTSNSLAERLIIEETGTVGINFPSISAIITSSISSNPTEITSLNHDLESGNIVTITGSDANPSINGDHVITVTSENTFTIPIDTVTGFAQGATTGAITINHADRVDNSNDIKLHVNGCIKLSQKGLGSSCLIFGVDNNKIEINNNGDFIIDADQDIDLSLNTGQNVNIPSNVGLTFSNDDTFIKYDGTNLCIESLNDIKMNPGGDLIITPGGSDVVIDGNLTVTGTVNFLTGGGGGGSGEVDDYIVCFGKGQDIGISSIQNGGGGVDITTVTAHNLIIGDTVTISDSDSTPSIDGTHTVIAIVSLTSIRIAGNLTVSGTTGNLRSKHVSDPGKDVGVCISWHDGLVTGTTNANEGFFGFDRSTERFVFIPDATIVADVITGGAYGDAQFNKMFLNNTEVSSLTETQLVFAGVNGLLQSDSGMTYNSTTDILSVTGGVDAPNLIEKQDFDANTILKADIDDTPVILSVPEDTIVGRLAGGQITALTSSQVNTFLGTGSSFERINIRVETTISVNSSAFQTEITTTTDHGYSNGDTVTISGSDATPNINGSYSVIVTATNKFSIPVDTTLGYLAATTGTVTPSGATLVNPDITKQVSFVNLTGIGTGSGTLTASSDGSFKMIILSSIPPGSSYELTLVLTDPGNATTNNRKLVFTCSGQSSHLIYDNVIGSWYIVNSGAFVV
jgi:hypothetical protein